MSKKKPVTMKGGRMHILGLPVEDVGESITGRPRMRISAKQAERLARESQILKMARGASEEVHQYDIVPPEREVVEHRAQIIAKWMRKLKVRTTTSAIRAASRERFKSADLRPRVNSKPRGYLRAQQRRVVAAACCLRYY